MRGFAFGVVFACSVGAMGQASAATVNVVYSGTFNNTQYGSPFGDIIVGSVYTARVVFDTDLGNRSTGSFYDFLLGGSDFNTKSPSKSASISANGQTISISGERAFVTQALNNGDTSDYYTTVSDGVSQFSNDVRSYRSNNVIPANLEQSFEFDVSQNGAGSGFFFYNGVNYSLAPQHVSVGVVSPVPFPASAPMFGAALLGLAGLGYAAKRKSAAAAA